MGTNKWGMSSQDDDRFDPTQEYVPEPTPSDQKKQEMLQEYITTQFQKKQAGLDKNLGDAKDLQKYGQYGDIVGKIATDYSNSQNQPKSYANRLQDLGKVHQETKPDQKEWQSVQPMFDKGVASARQAKDDSFTDMERGLKTKQYGQVEAESDATSKSSKSAQLLFKFAKEAKAKEAEAAGSPDAAAAIRAMDATGMSASEIKAHLESLKNTDYKDVLNNQSADKRLAKTLQADKDRADKSDRDTTFKLSERYSNDATTKATAEVRSSAARAEELAKKPSAVNDMGLVYSLMKSFDPGSTVREGEFAMAAKSGSLGDKWKAYVSLIESGQMTPEKRAEVMATIRQQASAQEQHQSQVDGYYTDLATQYKADPNLVVGKKRATLPSQENKQNNASKPQPKKPDWAD